jgi:hypothetical protein
MGGVSESRAIGLARAFIGNSAEIAARTGPESPTIAGWTLYWKDIPAQRVGQFAKLETAVELFVIQCTTCRARLKVNDESVIGDILACPKCGSMVQVVPPMEWKRAADDTAAASESVAAGGTVAQVDWYNPPMQRSKTAAVPPALPSQPVQDHLTPPTVTSSPALAGLPQFAAGATANARLQPPLANAPPPLGSAPPPFVAARRHVEANIWSRWAARARQDAALIGAGLASGMLLGGAVWLALAIQAPLPPAATAETQGATDVAQVGPEVAPQKAAALGVAGRRPSPTLKETTRRAVPSLARQEVLDESPAVAAEKPAATTDLPVDKPPAASGVETSPAADNAQRGPTIRLDPAPAAAEDDTNARAIDAPPSGAPPAEPSSTALDKPADEPADVQAQRPTPGPAAESEGLARRVLSSDEVNEALSQALPSVEFAKAPLGKFVTFIADFSGLIVVIDEPALAEVGLSRQSPVTIKLTDTTAGAALRAAAAKLGLGCVIRDGRVVVTVVKRGAAVK